MGRDTRHLRIVTLLAPALARLRGRPRRQRRRWSPIALPGLAVRAHGYEWYCTRCGGRQAYVRPPGRVAAGLALLCRLTLLGRPLGKVLRQDVLCCVRCHTCVAVRACRPVPAHS